jgi:nucleolar protein 58
MEKVAKSKNKNIQKLAGMVDEDGIEELDKLIQELDMGRSKNPDRDRLKNKVKYEEFEPRFKTNIGKNEDSKKDSKSTKKGKKDRKKSTKKEKVKKPKKEKKDRKSKSKDTKKAKKEKKPKKAKKK